MPCIIVTGHPSSGKTTVATLLKERALLLDSIDEVVLINEESEFGEAAKRAVLLETAAAEKGTRGTLKAAFDRTVGGSSLSAAKRPRRLIILDSLNYIKGYRYELWCISKAAQEVHGIVWVLCKPSVVREWNSSRGENGYSRELLEELMQRYEPPDERNRWDRPLFTVDSAAIAATPTSKHYSSETNDSSLPQSNASATSKSELLQQSVYNMHSLGDALNGHQSNTQFCGTSGANETALATTAVKKKTVGKSAFKRAPKKKMTPPTEASAAAAATAEQSFAYTPDDFLLNREQSNSDAIPELPAAQTPSQDTTIHIDVSLPVSSANNKDCMTLEKQLDRILSVLLNDTRALKEGLSTQQHVPGQAIGWKAQPK